MFGVDMIPHLSKTGPALDLFKAKFEVVMDEARSEQAASMTEFHWLGHKFPISNAKTRVSILKAIGAVLGQRTVERNQLFVSIAKSKR
ncbi:unnamed protein product [Lactuca virosa]|uniref:Uncharacterized protein n=1 Tax=Lactuca virosa TaxID=75947 RepID=A0AAU9P4B8_9ASTR|nr:unnamed protein product [Lactuca virosa]CAH1445073.1 unnamed protein product [Lactuca virosa]CAH1445081.1 unnamed protein product [Lactuca virosa]